MKKFLMAAVAASFISAPALAVEVPAAGVGCSTIHDSTQSGINVVELSDYRKCVMIQHDIDTAFTYKTFWVRNGDQFTSFKVSDLAKMNKSERVDTIISAVQKNAVIDALTQERDMLLEEREMLLMKLAEKPTEVVIEVIKEVEVIVERVVEIEKIMKVIEVVEIEKICLLYTSPSPRDS